MFNQLSEFIGKPITTPSIQKYLKTHRIDVPQHVVTDVRFHDLSLTLSDPHQQLTFQFEVRPQNPHISPQATPRIGHYIPVCTEITIAFSPQQYPNWDFAYGLHATMLTTQIDQQLSYFPHLRVSKEEGVYASGQAFLNYRIAESNNPHICYSFRPISHNIQGEFVLSTTPWEYSEVIFQLRDPLGYQVYDTSRLAAPFVEWAIHEHVLVEEPSYQEAMEHVRQQTLSGYDFLQHHFPYYALFIGHFVPEAEEFIRTWRHEKYPTLINYIQYTYGFIHPDLVIDEMRKSYKAFKRECTYCVE